MHRGFDSLKISTQPVAEPVSLEDMKTYMRLLPSDDAENALITSLIKAARRACERYTGRAFITQSWTKVMDQSSSRIKIEYPPLQTITSITSFDEDDVATVNPVANYIVVNTSEPGVVLLKRGASWVHHRHQASFEIIFVAGYGAAASDVPEAIIQGVKILVNHLYHNRGDSPDDAVVTSGAFAWLDLERAFV